MPSWAVTGLLLSLQICTGSCRALRQSSTWALLCWAGRALAGGLHLVGAGKGPLGPGGPVTLRVFFLTLWPFHTCNMQILWRELRFCLCGYKRYSPRYLVFRRIIFHHLWAGIVSHSCGCLGWLLGLWEEQQLWNVVFLCVDHCFSQIERWQFKYQTFWRGRSHHCLAA